MPINIIDALESDKQVDEFIVRREESSQGIISHYKGDNIEKEILKLPTSDHEGVLKKVRLREMRKLKKYRDIFEVKLKDMNACMRFCEKKKEPWGNVFERSSKAGLFRDSERKVVSLKSGEKENKPSRVEKIEDPLGFLGCYSQNN
ncbi:unnamed protein product [Blepharisma stoltei]|uniref:Uncharacterized protein n=1 Tax=Blepharisma stoltei TaxID=1481888 RepID=A0AAU9IF83_9CILI|nr:unnamed protein product [Blepharisma stoltei]